MPGFADVTASLAWLDRERFNLLKVFRQVQRSPALRSLLPELAIALFGYYEAMDRWSEMRIMNAAGREIAGALGFERLAAWLEHDLAIPDTEQGDLEPARRHLIQSVTMFRAIGDIGGEARCCTSLSYVDGAMNRLDEALMWAEQALELGQQIGEQTVVGISHLALGKLRARRGEYDLAQQSFDLSIALARESGNVRSLGKRYQTTGQSFLEAGQSDRALTPLLVSVDLFEQNDDTTSEAESQLLLGRSYRAGGNYPEAIARTETGLGLARAHTNKQREGQLLIELGLIHAAQGNFSTARDRWQEAAACLASVSPNDEAIALQLLANEPATKEGGGLAE
jgi:tetratricopeptide (TPR) repeat protein